MSTSKPGWTLSQALQILERTVGSAGVRRDAWPPGAYVGVRSTDDHRLEPFMIIHELTGDGRVPYRERPWTPTWIELIVEDWEIVWAPAVTPTAPSA